VRPPVVVYDINLKKVAYLENAFNVGYEKKLNSLWTAHFSLPADDPKNKYCKPLYYVEIFDGDQRVDLFRIISKQIARSESGEVFDYYAEHVLATLLDDVLFRYHQVGGTGVYTADVLQYILSHQSVQRWRLGRVEFAKQFQYSWENENLLAALFSVPRPFDQEYQWTWDTRSYPWTLNLLKADETLGPEIRYRRNLRGVKVEEDLSGLCTRLYALGRGEGVNQLSIEKVNPTGKPYIDADTQEQYGIVERVWVDRSIEDEKVLFHSAKAILEKIKIPRTSISVSAVDLYKITKDAFDKFELGRAVKVYDQDLGISYISRVVSLRKTDIAGAPGNIQIEIANSSQNVTNSIADCFNPS